MDYFSISTGERRISEPSTVVHAAWVGIMHPERVVLPKVGVWCLVGQVF